MIHDVLSGMTSVWSQVGLVLFLVFFTVVLIWTLRGGGHRFDRESRLPLDGEQDLKKASSESERM